MALHAKAKAEAGYRFYARYDKVSREDILAHAWAQCRSNKGATGWTVRTSRMSRRTACSGGWANWRLRLETRSTDRIRSDECSYRKPMANSGRWASRPCGIRVCMTAAMLVLEPIFEADLPPEQYAYRPGLGEGVMACPRAGCGKFACPVR